ncbi:ATP-binding protein [Streptomyces sp. JJ36]|uniref:ATP-binding protein n=1 Tax=Streptomyces sp. JJ36 TaxID=2736645 RepID=UPI001F46E284|nr:ATP-binding protein [Streptomyces sp. JJ36]MCF6525928.1 ATP-binding protein [Streptomyces sp. JJ36]
MTAAEPVPPREVTVGALIALDDVLAGRGEAQRRTPLPALLARLHAEGAAPLLAEAAERGLEGPALGLPGWLLRGTERHSLEWLVDLVSDPEAAAGPHAELLDAVHAVEGLDDALAELHERGCRPSGGSPAPQRDAADATVTATVVRRDPGERDSAVAWTARLAPHGPDGPGRGHDQRAREVSGVRRRWSSVTPATGRAAGWGAAPVRALLEHLALPGPPADASRVQVCALGLLPPSQIHDTTVALPAALTLLARCLDVPVLPYPYESAAAAGAHSAQGPVARTEFEPLPPEEAVLRADAAGAPLVHAGPGGWFRTLPGDGGSALVVPDPGLTLAGAAHAYWGEAWAAWSRDRHTAALTETGWLLLDRERRQDHGQDLPDVETEQVDTLHTALSGLTRKVAVLGGPSGSGKSVIARCTARRLAASGRQVVMLAPENGEFPHRDDLLAAVRHALEAGGPEEGRPRNGCPVVVLDGFKPMGETDVQDILPAVSAELDVSVLAVLEYDVNSSHEWHAEGLTVVPSIVRHAAIEDLVDRARRAHPELVGGNAAFLDALERRHHHDLARVLKGLRLAREEGVDTPERLEERLRRPFREGEIGVAAQRQAAVVAALSLLGRSVAVPDEEHAAALQDLGASVRPDGRLRFRSVGDCHTVLDAYAEEEYRDASPRPSRDDLIVEFAAGELGAALRRDRRGPLHLLRGAQLYEDRVARRLAERLLTGRHRADFRDWLAEATAVEIAEVLLAVDSSLRDETFTRLLGTMVDRLPAAAVTSARALLPAVRAVHRYRNRWEDDEFDELVDCVAEHFTAVLDARPSRRTGLYSILELLSRFGEPRLDELVARRGGEILIGLDPEKPLDYRTVNRVERLVRRARNIVGEPERASWVQNEDGVRAMLEHDPDPARGIALYLAALLLRIRYEPDYADWETVFERHRVGIGRALHRADAQSLRYALEDAREYKLEFVTKLLNTVDGFRVAIRNALRTATPVEAALLLRTTSEIHDITARDALYAGNGLRPDPDLARLLAGQVRDSRDAKGAGLLLSATSRVDELFLTEEQGFAQRLAEHLGAGWIRARLEEDPRVSVQYHLIKGLWEVRASFREECLDLFVDITARALNRSMRPWGPQAALLIGQDEEFGTLFLGKLSAHVSDKTLLTGMTDAFTSEAWRHFHRLGRAMYPALPGMYQQQHDQNAFAERMAAFPLTGAMLCARETARTLVDAGRSAAEAGRWVLPRKGDESPEDAGRRLAGRLHRGCNTTQVTEVLNVLARLHRGSAGTALASLRDRQVERRRSRVALLQDHVRQAMYNDPVECTRLLSAVEQVSEGAGGEVLRAAQQDTSAWNAFTRELGHIQHPTQQYEAVRRLVALGLRRGGMYSTWVERLRARHHVTATHVTSPAALRDALRMALIWDPGWAREFADAVPGRRVARRLGYARTGDLPHAVELIPLLHVAHADGTARLLLDALEELPPASLVRSLDLRALSTLLDFTARLRPDFAYRLARPAARAVESRIRSNVVFDDARHWQEIGWAARSLHRLNRHKLIACESPGRAPNLAHPYATAWGTLWLPQRRWSREALGKSLPVILRPEAPGPHAAFVALACASAEGRTAELRAEDGALPDFTGCRPRALTVLQGFAGEDPVLRAELHRRRGALLATLDARTARSDPYREPAREWFGAGRPSARTA